MASDGEAKKVEDDECSHHMIKPYTANLARRSFVGNMGMLVGHHQSIVQEIIKDKEKSIKKNESRSPKKSFREMKKGQRTNRGMGSRQNSESSNIESGAVESQNSRSALLSNSKSPRKPKE